MMTTGSYVFITQYVSVTEYANYQCLLSGYRQLPHSGQVVNYTKGWSNIYLYSPLPIAHTHMPGHHSFLDKIKLYTCPTDSGVQTYVSTPTIVRFQFKCDALQPFISIYVYMAC